MILTKAEKEMIVITAMRVNAAFVIGEQLSESDIRRCVSAADLDKLVALTDENEELVKKQHDLDRRGVEHVEKVLYELGRFFRGRN